MLDLAVIGKIAELGRLRLKLDETTDVLVQIQILAQVGKLRDEIDGYGSTTPPPATEPATEPAADEPSETAADEPSETAAADEILNAILTINDMTVSELSKDSLPKFFADLTDRQQRAADLLEGLGIVSNYPLFTSAMTHQVDLREKAYSYEMNEPLI